MTINIGKQVEIIKQIKPGDVFYIPTDKDKYGVGQILKLESKKGSANAMMVLLDDLFTLEEIKKLSEKKFLSNKILSLMPLNLILIKNQRWKVFNNFALLNKDIPMCAGEKTLNNDNDINDGMLWDYGNNFIRYLPYRKVSHMYGSWSRGPVYFEHVLKNRFIDKNFLPNKADPDYFFQWPEGTITENDMVINAGEYHPINN